MKLRNLAALFGALAVLLWARAGVAQESFAKLVGDVQASDLQLAEGDPIEVPFIVWGGEMATFLANGDLTTQDGTIFKELGLNLKLTPGDDFVGQVKNYMEGKTPFLRGTFSMLGQASEVINSDPRTQAVVFLQLTWSAGDHMVAREEIKTLNDLKGKKIAIQTSGPHAGLLDDILRLARLEWTDVEVVWLPNLTGENSPPELFRSDDSIAACMVISPDMAGLTGSFELESIGDGSNETIKGAHVLASTNKLSRSICDVYACRKDFFDAHKDVVEKFTAGYLKASENLLTLSKDFEDNPSPEYTKLLETAQTIWTKDVLPTLDDAHGLFVDCNLVGLPGNETFFEQEGNPSGFNAKEDRVLQLALLLKNAERRVRFIKPGFDYDRIKELGKLSIEGRGRFVFDPEKFDLDDVLASYTINFDANNADAEIDPSDLHRAIETTSTAGSAVIEIRGHADPTKTLIEFIQAGMDDGAIERRGEAGSYEYFIGDKKIDLEDTAGIAELVKASDFATAAKESAELAEKTAAARAESVRDALLKYAADKHLLVEQSQFLAEGVGIVEPKISVPRNLSEAKQNRRVEFRIRTTKVKEEAKAAVNAEVSGKFFQ